MARRTFIRLQLRKSSCDRVQSVLVLFSSPYLKNKKSLNRFHQTVPEIQQSLKNFIRLQLRKPSCVQVEILAVSIPSIHLSNQKTVLDYLYSFLSFSVHNLCARTDGLTDGQKFFENVLFFPPDQEYIYMSIPISIISQISLPVTKVSIPFFCILKIGM